MKYLIPIFLLFFAIVIAITFGFALPRLISVAKEGQHKEREAAHFIPQKGAVSL